ncbi:hypothetical protein AGQ48_24565 [Salmonella enterica subsp. enterica]|nr:hypothetical protein AGQ48_24565 [Salmonella enterica subsp. enterica]
MLAAWFIRANACSWAPVAALGVVCIARASGVAASGVVLFVMALVFTFTALVASREVVADEARLEGLVL